MLNYVKTMKWFVVDARLALSLLQADAAVLLQPAVLGVVSFCIVLHCYCLDVAFIHNT